MRGQMMDMPLLVSSLIEHADRNHGDVEIVSRTVEGPGTGTATTSCTTGYRAWAR